MTGQRSDSIGRTVFGRPFVKRFALCYQTVVCLSVYLSVCLSVCVSVLSVIFVHFDQAVGRITMKLGKQVGLGPGHIVLDGDPSVPLPAILGPYLLRPNGCMDQDVTWYGARPRPRRLCVRWRPSPPPQQGGGPPQKFYFRPMFIVAKRLDGSRCGLARR